jgi:hypothetical protein
MNYSDIKKITKILQYENDCWDAQREFHEHGGVKFYDRFGEGYINKGVKNYTHKTSVEKND